MTGFFRFPSTPHLAWLGEVDLREDKLLTESEIHHLFNGPVRIEEKVDGANIGLSVSEDGEIRVQNRGSYLDSESSHKQFSRLWPWLTPRTDTLLDALGAELILFGEWCQAVHSVRYDKLPDWFLGFDFYDRSRGRFWSAERRDQQLAELGLSTVPTLARGPIQQAQVQSFLGTSRLGSTPMEGVIIRNDDEQWNQVRAKLVRPDFVQQIHTHWSHHTLQTNQLALGV